MRINVIIWRRGAESRACGEISSLAANADGACSDRFAWTANGVHCDGWRDNSPLSGLAFETKSPRGVWVVPAARRGLCRDGTVRPREVWRVEPAVATRPAARPACPAVHRGLTTAVPMHRTRNAGCEAGREFGHSVRVECRNRNGFLAAVLLGRLSREGRTCRERSLARSPTHCRKRETSRSAHRLEMLKIASLASLIEVHRKRRQQILSTCPPRSIHVLVWVAAPRPSWERTRREYPTIALPCHRPSSR